MSYWIPVADRGPGKNISNYHKRDLAFRVYSKIYTAQYPHKARELIQYAHVIYTASMTYVWENVYMYDKDFRLHLDCICLRAEFTQNPSLLCSLLSTGDKLLVECSTDNIWGTGVPLYRWDCLQKNHWTGNGKLSELLMEIRNTCKENTAIEVSTSPPD